MEITLKKFIDYMNPLLCNRLNNIINEYSYKDLTTSINADIEFRYHCNKKQNIDNNKYEILNNYKCDILSERTLNAIFNACLENDINDMSIINEFIKLKGNKTIIKIIKHILFNSNDINDIIEPFIHNLEKIVNKSVENINKQEYIEQKTVKWFDIRKDMISASMCGYLNSVKNGLSLSYEEDKIMEKSFMKTNNFNGWSKKPLRHGQQFEDITGEIYNIFNDLISKEYGILKDINYSYIGASPDGIITDVKSNNYFSRIKKGRMREIKNPISRIIDDNIPSQYYSQMQQQLYVCQLPFCDFIQTKFEYPIECSIDVFIKDTMTYEDLLSYNKWYDIEQALSPYILDNLNFDRLLNNFYEILINEPLGNLDNVLLNILCNNWNTISYIPLNNINKRGQLKGLLWSFVKYNDNNNVDFKIKWLPINEDYKNYYDSINEYIDKLKDKYINDGYILEETHYWNCSEYKEIEVEYNKLYYEQDLLPILHKKWDLIKSLRILKDDIKQQNELYIKHYPNSKKINKINYYKNNTFDNVKKCKYDDGLDIN